MKRVDVTTAIDIARPRQLVAAYAADPDHAPDWYATIERVTWQTERPLKIGTRLAFVARFLGRTLSYTYEVIDFIPSQRLIMSTTEGPLRMETTYAWSDLSDHQTHMTLRNRGTPSGFRRRHRACDGASHAACKSEGSSRPQVLARTSVIVGTSSGMADHIAHVTRRLIP